MKPGTGGTEPFISLTPISVIARIDLVMNSFCGCINSARPPSVPPDVLTIQGPIAGVGGFGGVL